MNSSTTLPRARQKSDVARDPAKPVNWLEEFHYFDHLMKLLEKQGGKEAVKTFLAWRTLHNFLNAKLDRDPDVARMVTKARKHLAKVFPGYKVAA